MTDYVKSTNFASKDSLAIGNPLKIVKGTEMDSEFNNIATAVSTKADIVSPTFTGVPAAPTATAGTNTTQVATTAFVGTAVSNAVTAYDTALTVSTSQIEDGAVTNAKLAGGNVPALLGYTPVQQGTGTGQLSNAVKIGWDGGALRLEVDATNFGSDWPIKSSTVTTITTAQVLTATAGGSHDGVGTYVIAYNNTTSGVSPNGTIAGSSLKYRTSGSLNMFDNASGSDASLSGSSLSGTWKNMGSFCSGRTQTGSGGFDDPIVYTFYPSLWLRTA